MGTTKMYTQEQLDAAVAAAVAHAGIPPAAANKNALMYCWSHGYNPSHASADCLCCKPGPLMKIRYDTSTTCSSSHSDFDHAPPCISAANAKKATKPESFLDTPGRAALNRGRK
jgi:hypothetical protein